MKSARFASWFLSAAFVALMAVPHLYEISGEGTDTTSVEKRQMAKMPELHRAIRDFSGFARQFQSYYSDSFGLRSSLIHWNNLLRLRLLNESAVPGVRVGLDGWLFYADEWALENYENIMPLSPEEIERIEAVTTERRRWLEAKGIPLILVVAPEKHTIYSEFLPPGIHKLGKESRFDQVAAAFARHPEVEFIDTRPALLRAKSTQRLFHRTDTHWNDYGAFIGYGELMERLTRHFPKIGRHDIEDYTVSVTDKPGRDLAAMLSLTDVIREEEIELIPKFTPRARDGQWPYPPLEDMPEVAGQEMVVKETGDPSLPRAGVFRDSFSWALIPFLAESFQRVVFVWTFDFLPELIEREKPDVVIFECVERYLPSLAKENPPRMRAEL
ncbi:MAG: alginate O-acetyltransferase AlgX-related protein [Acidobacteriota bacterium]